MLVGGVGVGKKAQRSGVGARHGTGGAKKGEGDVCGRCTRAVTEGNTMSCRGPSASKAGREGEGARRAGKAW